MKILLGYDHYEYPVCVRSRTEAWLARLRAQGITVDGFSLTLNFLTPCLTWRELDGRWRRGDRELLSMYEKLAVQLDRYDVFVNYNGHNLHPEFVQQLPTFNVYAFWDDPESSEDFSRPVAWAYDLAMVGNVAALDMYRTWSVREVGFWPLGFRADDYAPSLTRAQILNGERDVDVSLFCERLTPWRKNRLDQFATAFPQGAYYGFGWPNEFFPEEHRVSLYQRTKIGPNFHNSTGPVNARTYILPANGVMQLCDNKAQLGRIFELDKEVVGYDTLEEAIDLCQYYLNHDLERREIAGAGWERALRDYNEVAVFNVMISHVEQLRSASEKNGVDVLGHLRSQRRRTATSRLLHSLRVFYRAIRSFFARRLRPTRCWRPWSRK